MFKIRSVYSVSDGLSNITRVVREGNLEEEVCYGGCDTYGFDIYSDEKILLSWRSGWRKCVITDKAVYIKIIGFKGRIPYEEIDGINVNR